MSELYETEEATREYDPVLFKRILAFAKPHRALIVVTIISLAISTAGELFIPMLIRGVLDNAVFISYRELRNDHATIGSITELAEFDRTIRIESSDGPRLYIRKTELSRLSREEERRLALGGMLDGIDWYIFPYDDATLALLSSLSGYASFVLPAPESAGDRFAAVRLSDLTGLPLETRRVIRSADYGLILSRSILFFFILSAILIASFAQSYAANLIAQVAMADMRRSLFKHVVSQSSAYLSRHPVGRLVTRITGDVETLNDFFTSVLVSFLKDLSIMVGVLISLFLLSSRLGLISVCTLPPVMVAALYSRVKARDAFRHQRAAVSRVNSYLSERLAGVHVVQLFRKEGSSAEEFAQRTRDLLRANLGEMYVFASFRPIVDFLSAATTAVVLVAGAYLYSGASLSLGTLVAFISLVAMFYSPVQDIAEKYTMLQSAMAGAERIFSLLDTDERISDDSALAQAPEVLGRIEFHDVHFSYKDGEEVLKGLSFTVERGETVAIVGYTGAGKTTVTNLLARMWDVSSGEITIDGIPIRSFPLAALRSAVLPVLQDVFLFSGTVADNIRLGSVLSDAEIVEAAKAVSAHNFIEKLPNGYQTILSEGASNISAGQRQLISFARVIAHDPRVLLLDEATSSIDTETERLIQLALERVLKGRTAIVIAHRLSTIRHADRILVLSGGRLVESGKHAALMSAGGMYSKLYRLQYERSRLK